MALRSVLTGVGSYLPERVLTNAELAKQVDTSDEWIVERTGIRERHIAADGEWTSDLACAASVKALEAAGREASDVDLIIVATTTPDLTFPATAARVQAELGASQGIAFDLQALEVRVAPGMAQDDGQPQADELLHEHPVTVVGVQLAQLAAMAQHEQAQPVQFGQGEAGGVGVVQDVGPVLVVVAVRDQAADFVQLRGPAQLALVAEYRSVPRK